LINQNFGLYGRDGLMFSFFRLFFSAKKRWFGAANGGGAAI